MDAKNRKRVAYPDNNSPLRESQGRQTTKNYTITIEEDEYNRRREEELRRQIMQKDADLNTLQKTSEYVRSQIGDPSTYDRSTNHFSFGGKNIAEREKSPFSLAPSTYPHDSLNYPTIEQQPPHHIKEHIANIQSDNTSLMRRLNLVLAELERVQREKDELTTKLAQVQKGSNDLQRVINGEDNMDKVNRYMQDDLIYERDRNQKIKLQIKEEDLYKNQLIKELRKIEDNQEQQVQDSKGMSYDLQQKLGQIQDIEKEHYFTQEKIKAVGQNIEHLRRTINIEGDEKADLQMVLSQMVGERNELLQRLDHLTYKYDECVKEISSDRAEMESHNKHHAKLITAKIIFQSLEQMQKQRKSACFQEFKQYCSFDIKCHQRLSKFAKVLDNLGKHKQRIGLTQWFQNTLKPLESKEQSLQLAKKIYDQKISSQSYYKWRKAYLKRIDCYDQKTRAVQAIWQRQIRDTQVEQKRAFVIWRDQTIQLRLKRARVKKLIWLKYFKTLNLAMNSWVNHTSNIDAQVRLNLLSKQFSHKQYVTLLFNSFKYRITEQKSKRQNVLFHTLKAWKDYLGYQKFLMASGLLALQFRNQNDYSIVKSCFDAMRQHKEQEKYNKTHQILHEQELPLIQDLSNQTEDLQVQDKFKQKKLACEAVKKMFAKSVYEYFNLWKKMTDDYKEKLRTNIKGRIIKCYNETMRQAFNTWRLNHNSTKVDQHQEIVNELQSDQTNLTNEVISMQRDIKDKVEQRSGHQSKNVNRCIQNFYRRMLEQAIGRWRDKISSQVIKENGADVVIRRLRMRLLKHAFDQYREGVNEKKKQLNDEDRCALFKRTLNERAKQQVYNTWRIFKNNHVRAKKYWNRIYLRLDLSQKQRAIKKWKEQAQKRIENILEEEQHSITNKIEDLNHNIGELHATDVDQLSQISATKGVLSQQCQRILANYFARFYNVNQARGFEAWKDFVNSQKHKEKLLTKFIDHWKKYKFYFVKSVFQNWIMNCNIEQRRDQVKKEETKIQDTQFQFELQTKIFQAMQVKLTTELDEINKLQKIYNERLQKSVQMIVKKVDLNHYMGQKRYILQQWREYVRREKAFITQRQKVIQKSLWKKGFQEIKNRSREVQQQRNLSQVLNKFRNKFWKRTCGNAFSVWRSGKFIVVSQISEEVTNETNRLVEEHDQKVAKRKEVNAVKSYKHITTNNLKNLWKTWVTVTKFLKLLRLKNENHKTEIEKMQIRNAIQKWKARKDATKVGRVRVQRLREQFKRMQLRFFFDAIVKNFRQTKQFVQRLSNFANIHDQHGIQSGFNAIMSFARAKTFVGGQKKANSTFALVSALQSIVNKKKQQHFIDLRLRCLSKRQREQHQMFTILHTISGRLRHLFLKWKANASLKTLAKEMEEEGPQRETVFDHKMDLQNVQNLLKEEGYDDQDIKAALDEGNRRQMNLMSKGIARMKHYNDALYVKPKMFDRWKQFVHLRKLFKYWLNFGHLRSEFDACDMSIAFNKWKQFHPKAKDTLTKNYKYKLDKRVIANSHKLEQIASDIEDKENHIGHLADQREALVDNYVKGQKLALALLKFNMTKGLQKAFTKWFNNAKFMKNMDKLSGLKRNLDMIASLKDRLSGLEQDNDSLANENEELRQFSLDGYEIAKNVQALTTEREKLSVDLADKAQMIRKLLDENDKLTQRLRFAQEEAQQILKKTQSIYGGGSSMKKQQHLY